MEDNRGINARLPPSKRSTFPPAQVTWIPRKRHNTRWPVAPPEIDAPLLADFQPLIKFELHPGQIDEPTFWEQQDPMDLPELESEAVQPDAQQAPNLFSHRLSSIKRPSLSTISEELKEHSDFPLMTSGRLRSSYYSSPLKRRSIATDKYRTPTKVASSPLKKFTITATPSKITMDDSDEFEETNDAEAFQMSPTKSATERNEEHVPVEKDSCRGHLCCPSTPLSTRLAATAASNEKPSTVEITSQQRHVWCPSTSLSSRPPTTAASVAVFDQPAPEAPTESEHESRRRVSLNNARRSDRRSDSRILKRVRNWVANTFAINRRHSIPTAVQEKPLQDRRHTLDVDVGRNPDIFSQVIQDTHDEVPCNHRQEAISKETTEMDADVIPQETAHSETSQEEAGQEENIPQTEVTTATSQEETVQQEAIPSSTVRKFTHIDWDLIKPINERYNKCPTTGVLSMSNSESPAVDAPTTEHITEPRVETPIPHSPILEASPLIEAHAADLHMTDAPAADANDDSELALLRNFVRRAQMKPKRRSSMNFSAGSPMAEAEIESTAIKSPRKPLGEKDSNSPNPNKKRKVKDSGAEEVSLTATAKRTRLVKPDLEDTIPQPQRKKRRKGAEIESPDDILNPDIDFSQNLTQKSADGGLRRSKRVATTKPTELATPSQIPVRLPGSSGMIQDMDMPTVSTVGLMQRKTEKDLATLTRTNTRRNKGGAVPVPARLADMPDVAADANTPDPFCSPVKPTTTTVRGGKAVRWDETLVRTQGEDDEIVAAAEDENKSDDQDDAEEELQPPQMRTELGRPGNPVGEQLIQQEKKLAAAPSPAKPEPEVDPEKKKKALRPRASRLPAAKTTAAKISNGVVAAATPNRKAAGTAGTAAAAAATTSSLPAPSRVTKSAARVSLGATPASKRTGILGASLGTPAPKRRGAGKK